MLVTVADVTPLYGKSIPDTGTVNIEFSYTSTVLSVATLNQYWLVIPVGVPERITDVIPPVASIELTVITKSLSGVVPPSDVPKIVMVLSIA